MAVPKAFTPEQQKQFTRFVEDAAIRALLAAGLGKDGVQKLLESGGEFQAEIEPHITAAARKFGFPNRFADEEVESSCIYPVEYTGAKPIAKQVDFHAGMFGLSLGGTMEYVEKVLPKLELPAGAEGWFAIPSPDALAARHFPSVTDPAERYCRAVELMLEKLGGTRQLKNYRQGQLGTRYLRQHPRTVSFLRKVTETQKGDILVVPAQFGFRYRGKSVRRAREIFASNEYGLGALAVGAMTLAHPERFVRWEQLHTDCAGDEYGFEAEGEWQSAPIFNFDDDLLEFGTHWFGDPLEYCGSASAFLP